MVLAGPVALLMTVWGAPEPAEATDPTINRLAMLQVAGRTSIVIELTEPVAHLQHIQPNPTEVVIEGGPVSPRIQARRFEPASPSPLVVGAFLTELTRPDGKSY